ncbi:MAG: flagellar biosynthesis protein FlhB [Phenylobacterium sp.]|uniref:flagellar biosynthesis protein FlhB n=1 Tax=Phenylobacterium sp. TaxID=1871053 RepID=UPI003568B484
MAEENEGASRTEEPTPHKLQKAREKGDVVKSQDLAPLAALLAAAGVMAGLGGHLSRDLAIGLRGVVANAGTISLEGGGGVQLLAQVTRLGAPVLLAVLATAAAAGVAANLAQHGFMFTPEKLKFDFKKLSPMAGLKRIFGPDGLFNFAKTVVKILLVAAVAWWAVNPRFAELQTLARISPTAILPLAADLLRRLVFAVAVLLAVVAGIDWFWQRARFMKRMRMTKEELKDEFKQTEGDPHVKARQRQLRIQRSRRRMMAQVPEATVVIMNPTHFAVALKYEVGEASAPTCVAKGLDSLALKIRDVARDAGVPVVEDPPLARALYAAVEIDEQIPPKHYEAVAKVIGFVLSAARNRGARAL